MTPTPENKSETPIIIHCSSKHTHEPEVPPLIAPDGHCRVCRALCEATEPLERRLLATQKRLAEVEEDSKRLDWLDKQSAIAFWQGSFSDSAMNMGLGRAGAPIATISTMDDDGVESNEDNIGEGSSIRTAIDAAINQGKAG